MKSLFPLLVVGFLMQLQGCSCVYIEPGHVGVEINRTGGGVKDEPLGTGYHFPALVSTTIEEYPIFMQTVVFDKAGNDAEEINVTTIESQTISFDVSLSFELDPKKVPALYKQFRKSIEKVTHTYVRQTVRDAMQETAGQMHILDVLGAKKSVLRENVEAKLKTQLEPYGFIIKQFTINESRAPQSMVAAIEAKNAMEQEALKAQNEMKKKEYEGQQKVISAKAEAEAITAVATAQAEANKILAKSVTPELVQYEAVKKWNGTMPQATGGMMPFFELGLAAK